jgi:NADPH-dependent glutamate synthase beta subunit-like oxidoreductase/dihydroorotate dehydrogenase/Pyruvate/2-oxoacid:ferredoxin oxidoreductase delta subunit
MTDSRPMFLTDAQLSAEIAKCEYCEERPCKTACPADCSPADFMMAAKVGSESDYRRAAMLIMSRNPLGGICGAVCPDRHCMAACSHRTFDAPLNIPAVQATIVQKAKDLGVMPAFRSPGANGKKVAVLGGGPAGLGAAALLAQQGYRVDVHEAGDEPGGMCLRIPDERLDKRVLRSDIAFVSRLGALSIKTHSPVILPESLLTQGYDAVIVTLGLDMPYKLGVPGEDAALDWVSFLSAPKSFKLRGKRVAVVGGGAVAVDCAEAAKSSGALSVEMFALETLAEMPLTAKERQSLLDFDIAVTGRTKLVRINKTGRTVAGIKTRKVALAKGKKFHPRWMKEVRGTEQNRADFDAVIIAIGSRPHIDVRKKRGVFYAGDMVNGPTTVVEAVAAGKNAGIAVDAFLQGQAKPKIEKAVKNRAVLKGRFLLPVSLETEFFGHRIASPFLLSAAPPTDGYEQMKRAYEAGWPGGIMKTAFDGVPIHIPGEYMFALTPWTYGNCDNVSGHPLARVAKEIEQLRREFSDRLTMASTGGPVTGHDESDAKAWQSNTKKLEAAGAMGIEYSLSCPQGGDGTKGDIVSQDAELTAKIVDWVMQVGDPAVPKLFKLTAAVTSIYPIITAIKAVFAKHPGKAAGVTLANTFPSLAFRAGKKASWEEGIVVGMSGQGVTAISNLTLANVAKLGVTVSGNGGPMDYKAAANFLALGVNTVQFCTIVMKHGYGIVDELHSGLSYLMAERGISSVRDLIGRALPQSITGFMELSAVKKISTVNAELCKHCGNCARCPYLAIQLDKKLVPQTDASRCIGCSICAQKCFAQALSMRARTPQETAVLREA